MIEKKFSREASIAWQNYPQKPFMIGNKLMLNIGCGFVNLGGFINIDKRSLESVDVVADLEEFPWPFEDESCSLILCRRVLEEIKPRNTINFMNECWRILEFGGAFQALTPRAGSDESFIDPAACSFWNEGTVSCFTPVTSNFYNAHAPSPWILERLQMNGNSNNFDFLLRKAHYANS